MQQLEQMTVQALNELTASNASVPGGGSISAMAGAYGAALAQMMAKLTMGREKYKQVEERMMQLDSALEPIRLRMLEGITKDTQSYDGFMQAMRLPKETDDEKAARSDAMQSALREACGVPLRNARDALEALQLAQDIVKLGNINTLSDGLVGVMMLRTAALGAINNVRINVPGVHDEAFRADMLSTCNKLQRQVIDLEQQAIAAAQAREEQK